jgi:hypothetical protein
MVQPIIVIFINKVIVIIVCIKFLLYFDYFDENKFMNDKNCFIEDIDFEKLMN